MEHENDLKKKDAEMDTQTEEELQEWETPSVKCVSNLKNAKLGGPGTVDSYTNS